MVLDDLRQAYRRIRSKPATVLGVAVLLALGVGLATAMFTITDALLLRPVPFPAAERLARLYMGNERGGSLTVAPAVFRAWRSSGAFERVESAIGATSVIESTSGLIARGSARVTPGLFAMLDVRPLRGRVFEEGDGRPGATDRIVISEDLWRSVWGSDSALLGRSVVVDGDTVQIVGIVSSEVRFPSWNTVLWRPVDVDTPSPGDRLTGFVRFAERMPRADALRIATDAAHLVEASTTRLRAMELPIAFPVLDRYNERALPLLVGAVALVFLVLCANVTGLLLVRIEERRREFSICSALGASRFRLLRETLLESTLLGVAGALAGVAFAWLLVTAARALLPEAFLLRTLNPLNVDSRSLVIAAAAGAAAVFVTGIWPASLATRKLSVESLKGSDRSVTGSRMTRAAMRSLVVLETALACTLLVGAVLLLRSFVNLTRVDRGLDTRGVVVATISLPIGVFSDAAVRAQIGSRIEEEVRRLPGVEQVAFSYGLPPDGGGVRFGDDWRSDAPGSAALQLEVETYEVGPEFFDLYRIPLLAGRSFQPGDIAVDVIVGERLAGRFWPGLDSVGRSFSAGTEQFRVVGVVREINHPAIESRRDRPEYYRPIQQSARGRSYFMISLRCGGACPDGAVVRHRLRLLHPGIRVASAGPLEDDYVEELAAPRAAAALALAFAVIGTIAAAGGLFAVLSDLVRRRQREFGVRAAVGASQADIRALIVREGVVLGVFGTLIGSGASWWLGRTLTMLQYGVTAADPVSWSAVIGAIAVTTMAAVWRPALRAGRVDPAALLRQE
jgi:predicted permease